jgi:hypothetical protein
MLTIKVAIDVERAARSILAYFILEQYANAFNAASKWAFLAPMHAVCSANHLARFDGCAMPRAILSHLVHLLLHIPDIPSQSAALIDDKFVSLRYVIKLRQ